MAGISGFEIPGLQFLLVMELLMQLAAKSVCSKYAAFALINEQLNPLPQIIDTRPSAPFSSPLPVKLLLVFLFHLGHEAKLV